MSGSASIDCCCEEPEACCLPDPGGCILATPTDCVQIHGGTVPRQETCDPDPCEVIQACCLPDDSCVLLTSADCLAAGGLVQEQETCEPDPCLPGPCVDCAVDPIRLNCPSTLAFSTEFTCYVNSNINDPQCTCSFSTILIRGAGNDIWKSPPDLAVCNGDFGRVILKCVTIAPAGCPNIPLPAWLLSVQADCDRLEPPFGPCFAGGVFHRPYNTPCRCPPTGTYTPCDPPFFSLIGTASVS